MVIVCGKNQVYSKLLRRCISGALSVDKVCNDNQVWSKMLKKCVPIQFGAIFKIFETDPKLLLGTSLAVFLVFAIVIYMVQVCFFYHFCMGDNDDDGEWNEKNDKGENEFELENIEGTNELKIKRIKKQPQVIKIDWILQIFFQKKVFIPLLISGFLTLTFLIKKFFLN